MLGLDFLILLGVSLGVFPCEGAITSPPENTECVILPGQTANITWVFNDSPLSLDSRSWSFNTTNGPVSLAVIAFNQKKPGRKTTLYDVDIVAPATLVLKNVNQSYNGFYSFSLFVTGRTFTRRVRVFVAKKPTVIFVNCSSPVTLTEGDNFTCLCKGEGGNPPANVTWYKNGKKYSEVGKGEQTLKLRNVGAADSGTYTCVATSYNNRNYTDEKSIQVIVSYKPTNTVIDFSPKEAVINGSVKITCTSEGFPKPNYTIKNGTMIISTSNFYFISNVTREDAGIYTCIASNSLGNDTNFKRLNVTERPSSTKMTSTMKSGITPSGTRSSSTTSSVPGDNNGDDDDDDGVSVGLIVGIVGGVVVLIVFVSCFVIYCKSKERENKRGNADVNPNGSGVNTNHYELEEEDHGGDAGAYDTVKQSDDGEGSQGKKKPAGASLPPVYAAVNKENRQGNTLYASLDSDALKKPGSKKKQPETRNAPTEYASIDFIQTGKTPNAENV